MTHSSLTNGIQLTSDSDTRAGGIDRFIVHHAATTSLAAILSLFQPGGRQVSANYALGSDGTLVLAVDESRRAWTSASSSWDGRAVTIEVANSVAGGSWPVSDAAFDKLARLIADVSARYGFPINDSTVLTHQELYTRYGASYATACPGDLQRRKAELLARANSYRSSGTAGSYSNPLEDDMSAHAEALIEDIHAALGAGGAVGLAEALTVLGRLAEMQPRIVNLDTQVTGAGGFDAKVGPSVAGRLIAVQNAVTQVLAKPSSAVDVSKLAIELAKVGISVNVDTAALSAALDASLSDDFAAQLASISALPEAVADEIHDRLDG